MTGFTMGKRCASFRSLPRRFRVEVYGPAHTRGEARIVGCHDQCPAVSKGHSRHSVISFAVLASR